MSDCMTIDDIKKDDTNQSEAKDLSAARDVVGSILEEAFHSAVNSDRDCKIGDFTEDFSQQFGQVSLYHSETNSSENLDAPNSINVGSPDQKTTQVKEYKVIDDSTLENNELCFENGQIHLDTNKNVKKVKDLRSEYFSKEDIIKDEKIEIEYFNGKDYNKIYVPINKENQEENTGCDDKVLDEKMRNEESEEGNSVPFNPVSSEELRQSILQVWENVNPSASTGWDGDMFKQPDEVEKMMEKLTSLQIFSNDPNRPRAYTLAEEEVKKMIKEIEEINFNQSVASSENADASYHVIGQGDYEAELDETPEILSNYISYEGTEIVGEEIFVSEQKISDSSQVVDLVLDASEEIKNFEDTFVQEDCDTWIPGREISSADSFAGNHPAQFSNSLGLHDCIIDSYCDEGLDRGVFASQKFNETYDFNVNNGIIGMPLTISNENFIDNSESIIQVIEANEKEDEKNDEISFSLLNEFEIQDYYKNQQSDICDYEFPIAMNSERRLRDTEVVDPRRVKSGMTTVGPMKNLNHDPRDLAGPEIDFGKMTIISGSEELTKEMFSCNKSTSTNSKNEIIDESDDEENVVIADGRFVAVTNLVNHDIASLSKLQKIREAISHQPRSVHDITDECAIGRDRLDLKDIENVSDERYNELSLPIITGLEMEPSDTRSDQIDILQGIPLVVKGSRDITDLYEESSLNSSDSNRNIRIHGRSSPEIPELIADEKLLKAQSAKTILKSKKDDNAVLNFMDGTQKDMETRFSPNTSDERQEHVFCFSNNVQSDSMVNKKHNTLSSVFRKASNKFMRKDSDSFLRNAKSLPRDTSKLHFNMSGAESIKSLIDDCQNSAANVIKKSRSLLKNTQSLLKTLSHTRFGDENSMEKRKSTSCDVELNNEDARPSTCPKKEESANSKSSIRSKIMKTFKSSENIGSSADERVVPYEHKKLSLILKNCKDYRVEKIEKVRKLLPKGSLFFKGHGNDEEVNESGSNEEACGSLEVETGDVAEGVDIFDQSQGEADGSFNAEAEIADTTYSSWIGDRGDIQLPLNRFSENSSVEEENFEWDFEAEVVPEKSSGPVQVDAEDKSEIPVSVTKILKQDENLKKENLPPKKLSDSVFKSDTNKASSHSLSTAQKPDTDVKPPEIEVSIKNELENVKPSIKIEEMVEVPLDKPEIHESGKRAKLENLEKITLATTEKVDIPNKWSSPVATDLRETSSRGSIKNKEKSLSGNNSEIKKRKKNKKLSARIRSFWLSAFGKAKPPIKREDAS